MSASRHFDTVAFDVRDDTSMLFFARTTAAGDIEDYLLIMRSDNDETGGVYLEINDQLLAGHDLISEARLTDNLLILELHEPAPALEGADQIALTYDADSDNQTSMEVGAFRVLGNLLTGGNA